MFFSGISNRVTPQTAWEEGTTCWHHWKLQLERTFTRLVSKEQGKEIRSYKSAL